VRRWSNYWWWWGRAYNGHVAATLLQLYVLLRVDGAVHTRAETMFAFNRFRCTSDPMRQSRLLEQHRVVVANRVGLLSNECRFWNTSAAATPPLSDTTESKFGKNKNVIKDRAEVLKWPLYLAYKWGKVIVTNSHQVAMLSLVIVYMNEWQLNRIFYTYLFVYSHHLKLKLIISRHFSCSFNLGY